MPKYDAILWDCDGCLIDSEIIACKIAAAFLTNAGHPTTTEEFIHAYAGKTQAQIDADISKQRGETFTANIDAAAKKTALWNALKSDLEPIKHIHQTLADIHSLGLKQAVASGSSLERLELTLKLTNMWETFQNGDVVFSAEQVPNGKPAPDVFLLAAKKINVDPARCVVIEDSAGGVTSGKAAGATVFGFTGSSHGSPKLAAALTAAGADLIFDDMRELKGLLND